MSGAIDRSPEAGLFRPPDVNARVAGFLRDLAAAHMPSPKMFGYKRAAAAVLALEQQLTDLVEPGGTLPRIPGIGPASTRVILEVLANGTSPTVERIVATSARAADIWRRRALRTNFLSRAEVLRVLHGSSLGGPAMSDYRGDLQMHSEWSDGTSTLDDIAAACIARGYSYAAVTDHSHGLKIAGGMSMADAASQHQEIDRINSARGSSFRLIKGIEANIGADGRLDLSADEAAGFELVLAAPHSKLRRTEDQTERLVRAVETPYVHVLAHPRGRITGSRAGVVANWDHVFGAAAREGVAIEIDGDPSRQDVDYALASRACDAGCLFALDSDAHSTAQLRFVETAIAHARLAAVPPHRIVNCWERDRLLEWLRRRHQ
jgi:histidinol phosphatase-like PHP family hydrolase